MVQLVLKCPLCDASFRNPGELRIHRLTVHRNIMDEVSMQAPERRPRNHKYTPISTI